MSHNVVVSPGSHWAYDRLTLPSGDSREITFLFQRVSVVVQRFNSVLLRESFAADSRPEDGPIELYNLRSLIFSFIF